MTPKHSSSFLLDALTNTDKTLLSPFFDTGMIAYKLHHYVQSSSGQTSCVHFDAQHTYRHCKIYAQDTDRQSLSGWGTHQPLGADIACTHTMFDRTAQSFAETPVQQAALHCGWWWWWALTGATGDRCGSSHTDLHKQSLQFAHRVKPVRY